MSLARWRVQHCSRVWEQLGQPTLEQRANARASKAHVAATAFCKEALLPVSLKGAVKIGSVRMLRSGPNLSPGMQRAVYSRQAALHIDCVVANVQQRAPCQTARESHLSEPTKVALRRDELVLVAHALPSTQTCGIARIQDVRPSLVDSLTRRCRRFAARGNPSIR